MKPLACISCLLLLSSCSVLLDFDRERDAAIPDSGAVDAGAADSGMDDGGAPRDSGRTDAGTGDAGPADGGRGDGGQSDGGQSDSGPGDGGPSPDAGPGCGAGFEPTDAGCSDIDECAVANGGCAQLCVNTDGSFTCDCNAGFTLNVDAVSCDDVDECLVDNGGCSQVCANEPGTFACSCRSGFTLQAPDACVDVDECADSSDDCTATQRCANVGGGFVCVDELAFTVVASDSFEYASGAALTGLSGGTGWSAPWTNEFMGDDLRVNATGFDYTGLATAGGRVEHGGGSLRQNSRTLTRQSSGVTYVQMITQLSSSSSGGSPTVRLYDGSSIVGGVGNNDGRTSLALLGSSLNELASFGRPLSTLSLVILRIDYDADTTSGWVDPDLSGFDYAAPPTPDVTVTDFAPAFDRVSIWVRSGASVDEIEVRSQLPPDPVPVASEPFDYVGGSSLDAAMGGTGWSDRWRWTLASGAPLAVGSPGLSYAGLAAVGLSAVWQAGGSGVAMVERRVARQSSGTTFVQFLSDFPALGGTDGTPSIRFTDAGVETGAIAAVSRMTFGILDELLVATSESTSTAPIGDPSLVVVQIDYERAVTSLYINPDLATFNYTSPPAPDALYDGLAPAFDGVAVYLGTGGTVDELSISSIPAR